MKLMCLLFTLLLVPTMSISNATIDLQDYINSFAWGKRIVLLITKENDIDNIIETDEFFRRNSCENESRNLEFIRIVGDDINKYLIPERYNNKYGIWLIGYDGGDKAYSTDASLLKKIHNIIDTMPIRQIEMEKKNNKCN